MAQAKLIDVADAAVTSLNAGVFETTFIATRKYVPRFEREAIGTAVQVVLVPKGDEQEIGSRKGYLQDFVLEVGVARAFDPLQENTAVDVVVRLLEQIKDHMRFKTFAGASWIKTDNVAENPFWSAKHLEDLHVFLAVARFTYRRIAN